MKAVLYKFCGKTILQVGPICGIIESRSTVLEEIEFDHKAIKIEKYRKEEEQRLLKLHQKMEKKKKIYTMMILMK